MQFLRQQWEIEPEQPPIVCGDWQRRAILAGENGNLIVGNASQVNCPESVVINANPADYQTTAPVRVVSQRPELARLA